MLKVFAALACVGFCHGAWAQETQTYITYNEIALSVTEEPGNAHTLIYPEENRIAISQKMVTKYFLELNSGRKLELSARRYAILAVLFKSRDEFASASELNRKLQVEFGFTVEDWPTEIAGFNAQITKNLGRPLVLQNADNLEPRFKIASDQLAVYGADTVFALHEDGKHLTYRGRAVEITPKQFLLVSGLTQAPNRSLSYAETRNLLGLSPASNRHLDHVDVINRRTFSTTGCPLIIAERGVVKLEATPMPQFPKTLRSVIVRGVSFDLGPLQQQAFDVLGLERLPLSWEIEITRDQFCRSGLNPSEMKTALRVINRKFVDAFGEPLVSRVTSFMGGYFSLRWENDDFSPSYSSADCDHRLRGRRSALLLQ